jgi:hypothetical protein
MEKSLRKDLKDLFLKVLCSVFRRQECITVLRLSKIVKVVLRVNGVVLEDGEVLKELCRLGSEGLLNFFEDRRGKVLARPSLRLLTMCFQENCDKDLDDTISQLLKLTTEDLELFISLLN